MDPAPTSAQREHALVEQLTPYPSPRPCATAHRFVEGYRADTPRMSACRSQLRRLKTARRGGS